MKYTVYVVTNTETGKLHKKIIDLKENKAFEYLKAMSQEPKPITNADIFKQAYAEAEKRVVAPSSQKPKELTEECIIERSKQATPYESGQDDYASGAKWAKHRSDEYWKAMVIEEARSALVKGMDLGADMALDDNPEIKEVEKAEEYINKLKEKYGISQDISVPLLRMYLRKLFYLKVNSQDKSWCL